MANQIYFFEKNKADFTDENIVVTASQGDDYAELALNRNNLTAWMTTGSVDADNTTYEVNWVEEKTIDTIILVLHNFKNYTVQYWNGSAYTDFSTAINVSNNTAETKFHQFDDVSTTKVKLTVTGTMSANDDKFLYQFIATETIGQLNGYPIIKSPIHSRNRQRSRMLSGKENVREQIGAFSTKLEVKVMSNTTDVQTVEECFNSNDGFLVWLCGGSESQFRTGAQGYRLEDIYLVKCVNEYSPELYKGLYQAGIKMYMDLYEVVD